MSGTWYVIQKRRMFWWHTLNIVFDDLGYAIRYLHELDEKDDFCETPLVWDKTKFVKRPFSTYLKVK